MGRRYNRIIAVDTENIHKENSIKYVSILNEDDLLVLMQSEESFKISLDDINMIRSWKCNVEVVKVKNGTDNAMDFGLVAEIAYRFGTMPGSKFYIISNDSGFKPIITVWRSRGVDIRLYGSMECLMYNINNYILQGEKLTQVLNGIKNRKKEEDKIDDIIKYKKHNTNKLRNIIKIGSKITEAKVVDMITCNTKFSDIENQLMNTIGKNSINYIESINTYWTEFKHINIMDIHIDNIDNTSCT